MLFEVKNYTGEGYQPLISFGAWRVAVLRHLHELEPKELWQVERHNETDEVFVLVNGSGVIVLGGNGNTPADFKAHVMKTGEICNVKAGVWHTAALSKDAHVIIVENDDTSDGNSEYWNLSGEEKEIVHKLASKMDQ